MATCSTVTNYDENTTINLNGSCTMPSGSSDTTATATYKYSILLLPES